MRRWRPPGSRRSAAARRSRFAAVGAACVLALAGCTGDATAPTSPTQATTTGTMAPSSPDPSASPTTATATTPTPEPTATPGFRVAGRVRGFDRPWDLRFLPDGTPLVTERPGRVAAVVDGRRKVVATVPGVVARGEGGLMGLALDPGFERNRRIYLCYAFGSGGTVSDVRVVRYELAEDLDSLAEATPLVTGIPAGAGNRHLGCRLEVGPDGMLWITTGDAVTPSAPQDPTSRAGKVLRATLGGEPAPDNPAGRWDPYVHTLGHRNGQGLAFRPSDGAAFEVEHGTACDDEINLLARGGNYGWDPRGPGERYAEQAPMTSTDIDGARGAAWSSGCPTIAPSGAEFITGAQWGSWVGHLAVAVLKDEQLLLARVDGGRVTRTESVLVGDLGRLRTVRTAPDGSLWVVQDASPGALVEVVPGD